MINGLDKALEYCYFAIESEKVPRYVKKQAIDFIEVAEGKSDKYTIDEKLVDKINRLTCIMNMSTGLKVGQTVNESLVGFQWLFIMAVLCEKHKDNIDKRRYNTALLLLARKSGKTFLIAVLFILLFLTCPKFSEFYSVAPDGALSRIVKKEIEHIIGVSPDLEKHFKIKRDDVTCILTDNIYIPLNYSTSRMDGRLATAWISDETGALPSTYPIDAMRSSQINMLNRLGIIISTAYPTVVNPMTAEMEYAKKVFDGVIEDDTYFALLYEPDNKENWQTDDNIIYQSNPLALEIKENLEYLFKQRQDAINKPLSQVNFLCKHCNIFLNKGVDSYINIEEFKECFVDEAPISLNNKDVYIGIDCASKKDLFGVTFHIPYRDLRDGKVHIYSENYAFLPNLKSIEEHQINDKMPYLAWYELGWVMHTDNIIIDTKVVMNFIFEFIEKHKLTNPRFIIDPSGARDVENILLEHNCEIYELYQSPKHLHACTNGLRDLITEKRIEFKRNDCLLWCFSNAYVITNTDGLIKIDKRNRDVERIDLVDSNIFATKLSEFWKPKISLEEAIMSDDFIV